MNLKIIFAFLFNCCCIVFPTPTTPLPDDRLLVVVTDGGADDATALIQILQDSSIRLLAIVCTYGNVPLEQACSNTRRTLLLMGKAGKVPVHVGSDKPFCRETEYDYYFGQDGFGNNSDKFPLPRETVALQHGAIAINSYVDAHQGKVTLLSLGPLTDLAVALKLDSSLPRKLKEVYIMGGSSRAVGNIGTAAEFNVYLDPEAARAVVRDYHCPITIVPYELCVDFAPTQDWFDKWVSLASPIAHFIAEIYAFGCQKSIEKGTNFIDCDLFAATVWLHPDVVTKWAERWADVETCGTVALGEFVVDNRPDSASIPNVKMLLAVDQELLQRKWLEMVDYDVTSSHT